VTTTDPPEVIARFHAELDLVAIVARSLHRRLGYSVELDDLMSAGREGLLEAVRRFDPGCGTPFRAFARFRVRGAMLDTARRHSTFSRRVHRQIVAERAALSFQESAITARPTAATTGSIAPSESSLANQIAAMATAAALAIESAELAEPPAREGASPEQAFARVELLAVVKDAIDELAPDEAELIRRHYFHDEYMEDIAKDLGMSKAWASRLHAKAIARLSKALRSER
jgi:RNA polymerase sigma factor FliA